MFIENINITLKTILAGFYPREKIFSRFGRIGNHPAIKGRLLEKFIQAKHEAAMYNPNLTRELVLKYLDNFDNLYMLYGKGILTLDEIRQKVPLETANLDRTLLHPDLTDEILTQLLLKFQYPHTVPINANSQVSLDFIRSHPDLFWVDLYKRVDIDFYLTDPCRFRYDIATHFSYQEIMEKCPHLIDMFINSSNLRSNQTLTLDDIFYLSKKYNMPLSQFSGNPALTFKFIAENSSARDFPYLIHNEFFFEREKAEVSFNQEVRIKKLLSINF